MLEWIRHELTGNATIFPDATGRIMTADQVIVFGTGGPADRGMLLCTLLRHQGIPAELVLTVDGAYVHAGEVWCDMATTDLVRPATETVLVIGKSPG
jgi:hypothetical protein